jgi:DNA-binding NtrC family response regulator
MKTEDLAHSQAVPQVAQGSPGLIIVHSPDHGLGQVFVPLSEPVTIGRRDDGDKLAVGGPRLAVADSRISREHVTLQWRTDGQGCEVRDLGSRNGTSVARRRVTSEVAPFGAIVRIGDTFVEIGSALMDAPENPLLRGRSAALKALLRDVELVAQSDSSALIEGETGTGKELVAEAIHALSGRTGKLVAINCASIPPELAESYLFGHRKGAFTGATHDRAGVFEQAGSGTLLLDEIGELRLDLQAKLLRVLETRQYTPVGAESARATSARFLGATNARLRVQLAAGTFRPDLFARLAGAEIAVPPLRRRRSDIPLLLNHFLREAGITGEVTFSANAMETLLLGDWPMNVRELKTVCGRLGRAHPAGGHVRSADVAAVLNTGDASRPGVSTPQATPEPSAPPASTPSRVELSDLLRTHQGNVVKLAEHYGKDRRQIYRWLDAHGLDPRDFRA